VINNALLSSAASLGTYTQTHKTTDASELFNSIFDRIIKNLDYAILILNDNKNQILIDYESNENLNNSAIELRKIRKKELLQGIELNSETFKIKMQESQLVIEQLIWLTNLSTNILNTTKSMILS
jgi:uncharacterized protein YktB (UPF0637 family)